MKKFDKKNWCGICLLTISMFFSCSDYELPEHKLDVEFRYELTCSDVLLRYASPEVTITDVNGMQRTFLIDDNMWDGNEHKKWIQSFHYDSLNVSNTMMVKYIPKAGVEFQDEPAFDSFHNLSCLINVSEDNLGGPDDFTIIPDFPSKVNVSASALKAYIEGLSSKTIIRGGSVDLNGNITRVEND